MTTGGAREKNYLDELQLEGLQQPSSPKPLRVGNRPDIFPHKRTLFNLCLRREYRNSQLTTDQEILDTAWLAVSSPGYVQPTTVERKRMQRILNVVNMRLSLMDFHDSHQIWDRHQTCRPPEDFYGRNLTRTTPWGRLRSSSPKPQEPELKCTQTRTRVSFPPLRRTNQKTALWCGRQGSRMMAQLSRSTYRRGEHLPTIPVWPRRTQGSPPSAPKH